jgi:hypothetical protein
LSGRIGGCPPVQGIVTPCRGPGTAYITSSRSSLGSAKGSTITERRQVPSGWLRAA